MAFLGYFIKFSAATFLIISNFCHEGIAQGQGTPQIPAERLPFGASFSNVVLRGTPAAPFSETPLTYRSLRTLIESRHIQSIDDLLPLLPESYRANYVLMYRTRSSTQAATHINPRVIMFGADASTILAFSGDPSGIGYNTIEIIEFNRDTNQFMPREIVFPGNQAAAANVQFHDNPQSCVTCHQEPFRPNWDAYPLWPGAYGSDDNEMDPDSAEAQGLRQFYETRYNQGRYRFLRPLAVLAAGSAYLQIPNTQTNSSPNTDFSLAISELNFRRILSQFERSSRANLVRPALVAAARGCFNSMMILSEQPERPIVWTGTCADQSAHSMECFFPASIRAQRASYGSLAEQTRALGNEDDMRRFQEMSVDGRTPGPQQNFRPQTPILFNGRYSAEVALYRYIGEIAGLNPDNWSTNFLRGFYTLINPDRGIGNFTDLIRSTLRGAELTETCEQLQQRSVAGFQTAAGVVAEPCPEQVPRIIEANALSVANAGSEAANRALGPPPTALARCSHCHQSDGRRGRPIPFNDPGELAGALHANSGSLMSRIQGRMASGNSSYRMPPAPQPLSPAEQRDILSYLRSLQ